MKMNRRTSVHSLVALAAAACLPLAALAAEEAPDARLRFVPKTDKLSDPLRDGEIDLDIGVVGDTAGPELYTRALFRDRHVGVVRAGHALARGKVSAARVEQGSGYPLLDAAALRAVRSLHTLPADAPREAVLQLRFRLR